jgi:hypothetical protein
MGTPSMWARAAFGLAVGLLCAWAAWQSLVNRADRTIEPWVAVALVAGCVLLAVIVSISWLPDAVVRRSAYMWGSSIVVRALITFAFAGLPAIVWAIAVISLFGTPS